MGPSACSVPESASSVALMDGEAVETALSLPGSATAVGSTAKATATAVAMAVGSMKSRPRTGEFDISFPKIFRCWITVTQPQ